MVQLTQPIADAIHQLEADAPLLSQLRRVWQDLLQHATTWAGQADVSSSLSSGVVAMFKARVTKHQNPAWAAAYLMDPINAVEAVESTPQQPVFNLPFAQLTATERDAALQCAKQLVDDPVALQREWDTLRLMPLPSEMSSLVPILHQKKVNTVGKREVVQLQPAQARRNWWSHGTDFPQLRQAALRLLSMHTTSCASERNWSIWGSIYVKSRNRLAVSRAEKLVFIRGNSSVYSAQDVEVLLKLIEEQAD